MRLYKKSGWSFRSLTIACVGFLCTALPALGQTPYPIRNHHTDHTSQFEYSLGTDKLIYARSLQPDFLKTFSKGDLVPHQTATTPHLFDELGYPYEKNTISRVNRSLLNKGEFISEISTACEILFAVSNTDRAYIYKPTVLERPITWSDTMGAPFEGELYLPHDRRAWSFSCSVRDKDIRRTDFMHADDVVFYYSDHNNVKHDFGFTATVYVLLPDGQRIMYWDTGLPASFSRGFLTPFKGAMQGQSLSAAGSTIFLSVVDSENRLRFFSRMYDYEINGACPGLTYTYKAQLDKDPPLVNGTVPLGYYPRKLPLEGWREHFTDGIDPSLLTSLVSIHLRGQGNSARELRIQGYNIKGEIGYYFKSIDELTWNFQPDNRLNTTPRILHAYDPEHANILMNYTGEVRKARSNGLEVKLKSFHPLLTAEEPSTLQVTYGGQTAEIELRTVDGWSLSVHKKFHEELVGVSEGEPKSLVGTLILPPALLNCNQAEPLCAVVHESFGQYHEEVNALRLVADNQAVYLRSNDGRLSLDFTRGLTSKDLQDSFFVKRAMRPELLETPKNFFHLQKMIKLNKDAMEELEDLVTEYRKDDAKLLSLNLLAASLRPQARLFMRFTQSDPTYEKATADVKQLFRSQAEIQWDSIREHKESYEVALRILRERLKHLMAKTTKGTTF